MKIVAELRGVTKSFELGLGAGRVRALDGVTLAIARGETCGLLGSNGSGKTTLLHLLLGLSAPTAGSCALFGIPSERPEARSRVGFLPDAPRFPRFLTGRELLTLHGRLNGLGGRGLRDRVAEVIAWAGLTAAADRRLGGYSKGMLQRLGLAQALVAEPELIVLNEPTAGMDERSVDELLALLGRMKTAGTTILLTSHQRADVGATCDRIVRLEQGMIVADDRVGPDRDDEMILVGPGLTPEDRAGLEDWAGRRGATVGAVGREGRWRA